MASFDALLVVIYAI